MKEETLKQLGEILKEFANAKIPAFFLAFDGEQTITAKNVDSNTVARMIVNHLNDDEYLRSHFVNELEDSDEDAEPEQTQ